MCVQFEGNSSALRHRRFLHDLVRRATVQKNNHAVRKLLRSHADWLVGLTDCMHLCGWRFWRCVIRQNATNLEVLVFSAVLTHVPSDREPSIVPCRKGCRQKNHYLTSATTPTQFRYVDHFCCCTFLPSASPSTVHLDCISLDPAQFQK